MGIGPNPRCWCAECGRAARSGSESWVNSIAISICGWARSQSTVEHVSSQPYARPCAVLRGAWVRAGGGRGGGGGGGGGGLRGVPRGERSPRAARASTRAARLPGRGGENQAAGRGQPRVRRLAGAGTARGARARGVWCVACGSFAAGSEVVRDELIGGLENTDQVVFLISACRCAGCGRRGVQAGVGCTGGAEVCGEECGESGEVSGGEAWGW